MSRISSSECFNMDMEWYGVDRQGNIAVFCSAGEGYLPTFLLILRKPAIKTLCGMEVAVKAVEYLIRTGKLYPGIDWAEQL